MAKQSTFRKTNGRETNGSMAVFDNVCLRNFLSRYEWLVFFLVVKLPEMGFIAASLSEDPGFSQIREAPKRLLSASVVSLMSSV